MKRPNSRNNYILQQKQAPPVALGEIAQEHWDYLINLLVSDRVLRVVDLPILVMACKFWEAYVLAGDNLTEAKKASDQYIKIMTRFGATYDAQQKLKVEDKAKAQKHSEDEMFEDF